MKDNDTIARVDLSHNEISDVGGIALAQALGMNYLFDIIYLNIYNLPTRGLSVGAADRRYNPHPKLGLGCCPWRLSKFSVEICEFSACIWAIPRKNSVPIVTS